MGHGFGGTQQGSVADAAARFAEAGLCALTFDYRGFGESGGCPRQVVDIRGQLADWRAAIAFARSPSVGAGSIALWGSSLGGGHVLAIAATDPSLSAVVAQVPFVRPPRHVHGRTPGDAWRLLRVALRDWWAARTGQPRIFIKAVGEPGELAAIASHDAVDAIGAMRNDTWHNEVAPGALIDMALWYRPGRRAARISMPLLLFLAGDDREAPAALARPVALRAPKGELRSYPCTHFDFYREPVRSMVIADQVSFLRTHLIGTGRGIG